uniref:DUF4806 domain-containing protein n=1 Tax=Anopheles funestus TaxID=62324 RepID=A0A4Y0BU43_ANOFN
MPYVLVEIIDAVGNKELLVAPETWIQRNEDGTVYLRWPSVRNITMLNALLADERSTPLAAWETHECMIKCSNIQSLSVAGKMIKTLQNHWKTVGSSQKRTVEANDDGSMEPVCKKSLNNCGESQMIRTYSENVPKEELEPVELQIIGMLNELRRLIETRHDEARKKLHDGFYRVEKSLQSAVNDSLKKEQKTASNNDGQQCSQSVKAVEFYVNPLTCIEEMADFEERLNDEEYRKQVQHWIDCTIGCEVHPENRMQGILDALFDKHFLAHFSWAGNTSTSKLAFMEFKNIVNLFTYAGTTAVNIATSRYVGQFFIKVQQRAALRPMRKNFSPTLVTIDSTASLTGVKKSVQKPVESINGSSLLNDDDPQNSDDNAEFCVNPLASIEELDAFETKLDDVEYRAQIHKWVNEHVAYEINPETRMIEILYLLFDSNFLPNFTWIGARKGSYGMKTYKNVVQLFQYVGTTAAHRADYIFVANFFNKKLRYAGKRAKPSLSSS